MPSCIGAFRCSASSAPWRWCYILASRLLPFSLFGLLSYVEPVLLVIVALLLGESIGQSEWPTYLAIWLAVLLLAAEGAQHLLRRQRV